jgi:hypothetical protein
VAVWLRARPSFDGGSGTGTVFVFEEGEMVMSRKRRNPRQQRKSGDANQLAAQLAPLEEQNQDAARKQGAAVESGSNNGGGAIRIDNQDLRLPKGVNEAEGESPLGIDPLVVVILAVLLAYVVFIAWQVSLMPATP